MYSFYPYYGYGTGLLFSRRLPYIVCVELCCCQPAQPQVHHKPEPFKGGKG